MSASDLTRRDFLEKGGMALGAAGLAARGALGAQATAPPPKEKALNYNKDMEYRLWGKANLWISGVCLGGHMKRIGEVIPGAKGKGIWGVDIKHPDCQKNRYDVVSKCMEVGINYIDACTYEEVLSYSKAIEGRRDKMYLGFSWYEREMRRGDRTPAGLLKTLEEGMKQCGIDYVDLWRITMHENSSKHTEAEVEQMMKALETAKKQGKARFVGFSSHDRPHIKWMIDTYTNVIDGFCTPYTAKSKELPTDSVFESVKKHGVGVFGIKPFASGSLFKGRGSPKGEDAEEDNNRARLAIRYILCNPAITAPLPGMITTQQVENVAKAVKERRELDKSEKAHLERAMDEAWAKLPPDYQWLKDWEWV
jgi:predicted aldo/keto reductase-like oxidoreductase